MTTDPKNQARSTSKRNLLTVVSDETGGGQSCTTCHSNEWIWDEEVELVRMMTEIKQQVRDARERGDEQAVRSLRERFTSLRSKMEKVRRQRLDSLGHYDYD